MINSSATVSAELGLTLVVPEHGTVPLVASLYYSADDPFAIRMAFHVGLDEPVEWIFARELLAAGLAEPAGKTSSSTSTASLTNCSGAHNRQARNRAIRSRAMRQPGNAARVIR